MAEVVKLELVDVGADYKIAADQVLTAAVSKLGSATVIGIKEETGELYIASTHGLADLILTLERAKLQLLA